MQLNRKKNLVIHFHVQRAKNLQPPTYIRFEKEVLNIGKAFDMVHGIFTAPVAGLYQFQFTGLKDNSKGGLDVRFVLNNDKGLEMSAKVDASPMYVPISMHTFCRLKPGDGVRLSLWGEGKLYEGNWYFAYSSFSGLLIEEDSYKEY